MRVQLWCEGLASRRVSVFLGLIGKWWFGDGLKYLFVIGADAVGSYYDFSEAEEGEKVQPSLIFSCALASKKEVEDAIGKAVPAPGRKPTPSPEAFDTLLSDLEWQRPIAALVRQIRERVRPCWNPRSGSRTRTRCRSGSGSRSNTDGTLIGRPRIVDQAAAGRRSGLPGLCGKHGPGVAEPALQPASPAARFLRCLAFDFLQLRHQGVTAMTSVFAAKFMGIIYIVDGPFQCEEDK